MSETDSAKKRLGEELSQLRIAGDWTFDTISRRSIGSRVGKISTSTLGDWCTGKVVPADPRKFQWLVSTMTGNPPTPELTRLYDMARQQAHANRGRRQTTHATKRPETATSTRSQLPTAPRPQPWLPKLAALHYAKLDRLTLLLAEHGIDVSAIPKQLVGLPMLEQAYAETAFLQALRRSDLSPRRLTSEFQMRSLRESELVVFDRKVHTRNGPAARELAPPLTGDLNVDPFVWFQKDRVGVIMPIDPQFISTSTAIADFRAGTVRMAGLFLVKGRGSPRTAPYLRKAPQVLYRATPLILGITDGTQSSDLISTTVFTGYDLETEEMVRCGPWNVPK
ncbi:hypothetical protein [Nocardia fluminea]|uniref:hypothetical protein n=1 Tax=Nocardia fluminea TaxID=134984 RepID=UPI0033C105D1